MFHSSPEISWNQYFWEACLADDQLTELGQFIADRSADGTFVDVPCGNPALSSDPDLIPLIAKLGFANCIEVDADEAVISDRLKAGSRMQNGIEVTTVQADILEYVQSLEPSDQPRIIYISGLQPLQPDQETAEYLRNLYQALLAVSTIGDLVAINDPETLGTGFSDEYDPVIALNKLGFALKRKGPKGKVKVLERVNS